MTTTTTTTTRALRSGRSATSSPRASTPDSSALPGRGGKPSATRSTRKRPSSALPGEDGEGEDEDLVRASPCPATRSTSRSSSRAGDGNAGSPLPPPSSQKRAPLADTSRVARRIESLTNTPKRRSKLSTPVSQRRAASRTSEAASGGGDEEEEEEEQENPLLLTCSKRDACVVLAGSPLRGKTPLRALPCAPVPVPHVLASTPTRSKQQGAGTAAAAASPQGTPSRGERRWSCPPDFHVPVSVVRTARAIVLARLGGAPLPKLIRLDDTFAQLYGMLERTISTHESNSAILAGPRGTGKRSCVHAVLERLAQAFAEDGREGHKPYFIIRLNGLVHVDDKLALDAILRALCLEEALAAANITSYAESLEFVVQTLAAGSLASTPVLVIMEEFDLFLDHYNQSMVYTLLDTVQNRQNPMAVLGLSNRMDSSERMEKRVKSRFSNRILHVYPQPTLAHYLAVAQAALQLGPRELEGLIKQPQQQKGYRTLFNAWVADVLADAGVRRALQQLFDRNRSVPQLFQVLRAAILTAPPPPFASRGSASGSRRGETDDAEEEAPVREVEVAFFLLPAAIQAQVARLARDPQLVVLQGLTTLEHCLLAAVRKSMSLDTHLFNFEMVYDTYLTFLKGLASQGRARIFHFSKRVAITAWESLIRHALLLPAGDRRCQREYQIMRCKLDHVQLEEGMRGAPNCPEVLVKWAFT